MFIKSLGRRQFIVSSLGLAISPMVSPENTAIANQVDQDIYGFSVNGWPVQNPADVVSTIEECGISGVHTSCEMRIGDAALILSDLVRQLHYRVKDVRPGEVSGWKNLTHEMMQTPYSNLSSGTALQVRPTMPVDSYFAYEIEIIQNVLKDYAGVILWGGDLNIKDESLFYINKPPTDSLFLRVAEMVRMRSFADIRIN